MRVSDKALQAMSASQESDTSMLKLQTSSLDWALKQAEGFGDTDIFPLPFEFSAIRHDWCRLAKLLSSEDILKWVVRPHRECLSPKSAHSFRISTQLDPLDWLIYTALVYEVGTDLESFRLPQEEDVVFSYRFEPQSDGTMFSRGTGYSHFQKRTRELADVSDMQYVVLWSCGLPLVATTLNLNPHVWQEWC